MNDPATRALRHVIAGLRLPVIAAPMFLVSGVRLVVAACREGVIGSFPTAYARTTEMLEAWLRTITAELARDAAAVRPVVGQPHRASDELARGRRP